MLKMLLASFRKITFGVMKKKFVIINALMSVVILFAIFFQSVHSYEHLVKKISEKKCLHKHVADKEITHRHNDFDKCFVCEFSFSSYINADFKSFLFQNDFQFYKNPIYFFRTSNSYFSGICYSLRGPPAV